MALIAALPGSAAASDLIVECGDCPVGVHERASLARWLRGYDVVFEGACVGADTVRSGYDHGRPRLRFRIDRLLRGFAPAQEIELVDLDWRLLPESRSHVLAWVLRGCTIDRNPCGGFVTITSQRTMYYGSVTSDWRREPTLLKCDSLERDIVQEPDSTGLDAFHQVTALALAHLEIQDPVNPPRKGLPSRGFPDNGGTWPLEGIRWLLGRSDNPPHFVRFPRVGWRPFGGVDAEDRFLLPLHEGDEGDTLIVTTNWRPMLVRGGEALGFGVPVDSLPSLYVGRPYGYELTIPVRP